MEFLLTAWVDDVMIAAPSELYEPTLKLLESKFTLKRGARLSDAWSPYLGREWRTAIVDGTRCVSGSHCAQALS